MLVSILLLSLTLFSQTDTNKLPIVCISQSTAQKIAVDLLRLDSVLVELKTTKQVLHSTELKVTKQDSLIRAYSQKIQISQQENAIQIERYQTCSNRVTKLERDVVDLTNKNIKLKTIASGLGGGLVISLGVAILSIVLK